MVLFLIVNASYPHTKKSVQFQLQYNYCGNLSLQDPVHVIVFHVKFESSSFLHCASLLKIVYHWTTFDEIIIKPFSPKTHIINQF